MILPLLRWEVRMKRKTFWQLSFLLLALINILIELRRDHMGDTAREEFAYCEQLSTKPDQKANPDQARKSKTSRPNETLIIKQR
jgi:hypothetical protein